MVEATTGLQVTLAPGAGPDKRSYRVELRQVGAALHPAVDRPARASSRCSPAYTAKQLTLEQFLSPRFQRIGRLLELVEAGELDAELRRRVRA